MTELKHDPELPFVAVGVSTREVFARFSNLEGAVSFSDDGPYVVEVIDTTPKRKIPEDAQHITWGQGRVAYSRYEGQWVGWNHGYAISEEELLTWIGEDEVTVLVRKEES